MIRTPRSFRRALLGAVAGAVALVAAPGALAQDTDAPEGPPPGARVVHHCVEHIARSSVVTSNVVRDAARWTVRRIAALDAKGAPDEAIVAAAERGADIVKGVASAGAEQIVTIESRCEAVLDEIGAGEGAQEVIDHAAHRGLRSVRTTTENSLALIRAATERALRGDEDMDPSTTATGAAISE